MKNEEVIARYGEAEYARRLEEKRAYYEEHKEEEKAYREEHPEKVIANSQEQNRKGGKRYGKTLKDDRTGLRGDRNKIRSKHRKQYRPYKNIIAPESQIHHEWVPKTAEYRGVALVEKEPHQYGIVDVIEILDGKITLLTEDEIKKKKQQKNK